jgi:hypothetical protein
MAAWSVEYLGWAATAVFVGSYLCRQRAALTRLQIVGALMWVAYGLLIGATPVVAANLLVVGAAAIALSRDGREGVLTVRGEGRYLSDTGEVVDPRSRGDVPFA